MRANTVALIEEIDHLGVPVVCAQWPGVMEDDRLSGLRPPVLLRDCTPSFTEQIGHLHTSHQNPVGGEVHHACEMLASIMFFSDCEEDGLYTPSWLASFWKRYRAVRAYHLNPDASALL